MDITFTLEELLGAFEAYNLAIWPMQVLAYLLGMAALALAVRPTKFSNQIISGILAFFWLWTGAAFFMNYFAPVYFPAYVFGGLFILQGILFLVSAIAPQLSYGYIPGKYSMIGLIMAAYALLGYPLFGYLIGHRYPQSPAFGLTPCPLAAFTFGLFLLTDRKFPKLFLIIPVLWAVGGFVPVSVGVLEDIGLIVSGLAAAALIYLRDRKELVMKAA